MVRFHQRYNLHTEYFTFQTFEKFNILYFQVLPCFWHTCRASPSSGHRSGWLCHCPIWRGRCADRCPQTAGYALPRRRGNHRHSRHGHLHRLKKGETMQSHCNIFCMAIALMKMISVKMSKHSFNFKAIKLNAEQNSLKLCSILMEQHWWLTVFRQINTKRLAYPYGDCVDNDGSNVMRNVFEEFYSSVRYTAKVCISLSVPLGTRQYQYNIQPGNNLYAAGIRSLNQRFLQ